MVGATGEVAAAMADATGEVAVVTADAMEGVAGAQAVPVAAVVVDARAVPHVCLRLVLPVVQEGNTTMLLCRGTMPRLSRPRQWAR